MTDDSGPSQRSHSTAGRVRGLAFLTLIAGIAVSLYAWHYSKNAERRAMAASFQLEAEDLQRAVLREFSLFSDVLQSIGLLHSLSDQISQEDFEEFAGKGMIFQKSILGAYGFVQRVPNEMRAQMEQPSTNPHETPFQIVEVGADGEFRRADERPIYFPLTYQSPPDGLGLPQGYDFASDTDDLHAMLSVTSNQGLVLGGMVSDRRDPARTGYHVFAPIANFMLPADDSNTIQPYLVGFSAAILWPQDLLRTALGLIHPRDKQVSLFAPLQQHDTLDQLRGALVYEAQPTIMNAPWLFRCTAGPDYVASHSTGRPTLILASGLAITFLLTLQFMILARRTKEIEKTVHERTVALTEANRNLEKEIAERRRLENEFLEFSNREQQRVGRDLHDSLGQKLAGAVFLSRALTENLTEKGSAESDAAQKMNEILKESVAQVRRIARGLSPVDVGDDGLDHALRRLADETCDVYSVQCTFQARDENRIGNGVVAAHLFQIAQEAVTNAIRHGQAREIKITLETKAGNGRITVEDNGTGFNPDVKKAEGMGLRIMRYRADMIGGNLSIEPRPQGGTIVACSFPPGNSPRINAN